jgi:hypothetical protein
MNPMRCLFIFLIAFGMGKVAAQQTDAEYGKIALTPHINNFEKFPAEFTTTILRKLEQSITKTGSVAVGSATSYVLSAELSVGSKDIVPGPPQMIALNLELILRVGDISSGRAFSMTGVSMRGVGTNENKAILDALKSFNPGNTNVHECLTKGKAAIVEHYRTHCSTLIDAAMALAQSGRYEEAMFRLSTIPDASESCYKSGLDASQIIYQAQVNQQGAQLLQEARSAWNAEPNEIGAQKAAAKLEQISAYSTSFDEAKALGNMIMSKFEAQQQAEWNLRLKQYADEMAMKQEAMRIAEEVARRDDLSREAQQQLQHDLETLRVKEYGAVAREYARNQPKSVTYNTIVWR